MKGSPLLPYRRASFRGQGQHEELYTGLFRRYNAQGLHLASRVRTARSHCQLRKDRRMETQPTLTIDIVSDIV